MTNIVDTLKQLFIVVTTSVAVLNPFNVTLPTKNAVETPQAFIENAPTTVPNTPTSIPYTQPVRNNTQQSAQKSQSIVDCTGPDGKHFQTTQQECDKFNSAWGKNNNTQNEIAQNVGVQTNSKIYKSLEDYVQIPCITEYSTFTSYGKTYDEAVSSCSKTQAFSRSLKANNEESLLKLQQTLQKAQDIDNEILNHPFLVTPVPNIVVPTTMNLPTPTPKTCWSGGTNSYGAVGAIYYPC